jgi:hypothetical protein
MALWSGLALFIPDTIDERPIFKLLKENQGIGYEDLCQSIWPRKWLDHGYSPIADRPCADVADAFFPLLSGFVLNNMDALLDVVNGQISDRDYRLVNQCSAFAFILLKETPNSEGVKNELNYAKSVYKHTHFFNPDNISPDRSNKK